MVTHNHEKLTPQSFQKTLAIRKSIDTQAKTVYISLIPVEFLFELKEGLALPAQSRREVARFP